MTTLSAKNINLKDHIPFELPHPEELQTRLPEIAKLPEMMSQIAQAISEVPTNHQLLLGDARKFVLPPASVHLVLCSPPYWTLKEYVHCAGQMGDIDEYSEFLNELELVWKNSL